MFTFPHQIRSHANGGIQTRSGSLLAFANPKKVIPVGLNLTTSLVSILSYNATVYIDNFLSDHQRYPQKIPRFRENLEHGYTADGKLGRRCRIEIKWITHDGLLRRKKLTISVLCM